MPGTCAMHANGVSLNNEILAIWFTLTAFNQRNTPLLDGKLTRGSADSFTDERSGASYFLARVAIDAAELKKLDGRELYPGMGAEVMIKTGKRTTMDYILAPLTDSLRRAFRDD